MGTLARDERGGEVLEYALILGIIVVVCITAIGLVGARAKMGWTYINSKL